jgi:hypothetical protein
MNAPSVAMSTMPCSQSTNFFAALDDSGDEGPAPAKQAAETKKENKPKPQQKVLEASQVDPKYVSKSCGSPLGQGRIGRMPFCGWLMTL